MSESVTSIKKTALHQWHVDQGARMIEFAGFDMPVWYKSINDEHRMVRTSAGLFDLSHMGELFFRGPDALDRIQWLTTNNAAKLEPGQAQYTLVTNEKGGIRDDVIVYRTSQDEYMVVVNASNVEKIIGHISGQFSPDVFEDRSDEITLIALQGPEASAILGKIISDNLSGYKPFSVFTTKMGEINVTIARTGYTGEDGFEIFCDNPSALEIWSKIMEAGGEKVEPIGLGARDTLRLEVCYSLYGNEIGEESDPFAARLGWVIKLKKGDFLGRDAIVRMKEEGSQVKLVGFEADSGPIPRHGLKIFNNGEEVGELTSGCLSPMSGRRIGLGYVPNEISETGTILQIEQRGRMSDATIVELPFYSRP